MNIVNTQKFKLKFYNLEILNIQDLAFNNYPEILNGYIFHFYIDDDMSKWNSSDFLFDIKLHQKYEFEGDMHFLKIKLEEIKDILIKEKHSLEEQVDQFAYITAFIIKTKSKYKLLLTSETFELSNIIKTKAT